jgi:hypothetical protein
MMRTFRPVDRGGDRGAALLLVLLVITAMAVGVAGLLSFVDTSLKSTMHLRDQAAATYNADGVMQAAINNIRNSDYRGAPAQTCPTVNGDAEGAGFYGPDSAAVSCTGDPATVRIHCPSLTNCNRPGNAILTLGEVAGEDAVRVEQNTNSTFRVHGGIFSNSNINVVNGTLETNTRAYARGACSGTIMSTPTKVCNYGTTANPLGDDPGYTPDITTVPELRTVPTTCPGTAVVEFLPGYYDDADALSNLMKGNGACKDKIWWFKPGPYYFDFHNSGADRNKRLPNVDNVWKVLSGTLIAGTPVDASGAPLASPPATVTLPGACDNPIRNPAAKGVQFIFGGDSRLEVKAANVELCGTYRVDRPPVAIYGLTTGAATTKALTGANTLRPSSVTTPNQFSNATDVRLANQDASAASWKSGKKNDSTTLTVSGFAPPSAIPKGSVLIAASLRVTHRHDKPGSVETITAEVTPSGGTPVAGSISRAPGASYGTDTVSLDDGTGSFARAVYDGTFTGASAKLTVKLSEKDDTEDIDAIQLDLTYVPPALRKAAGCVTDPGAYTGGSSSTCALINTVNTSGNQFYVQGTTYAPKGVVDLTLNNVAEQVFRFGVVVRALWVKVTGSFSYSGPVIEVPDDAPGFAFGVFLTAYVCPAAPTCDTTGAKALSARVAFVDADPGNPEPGERQVIVLSWSRPFG